MEEARQVIAGIVSWASAVGLIIYVTVNSLKFDNPSQKPLITVGLCFLTFFGAVAALT